ncbi:MAG: hypothetical protein K8R87_08285 [Verrucomicrobia bacterium]|nr:hypothetical protein [Verrucomicrobiota bacterium]
MKRKLLIAACVIFGITGIAAASAAYWYHHNFQAAPFKPVQLSPVEQQALEKKLQVPAAAADPAKSIVLSEREINGWLQEQGLGEHLKVSIGSSGITVSALLPVDGEVPFIGGKTVRFKIALNAQLDAKHHLALQISNVAVGGISPPNAWLGGIKGQDLLADAELDPTAKAFVAGIKSVEFSSGEIRVQLNE